MSNSVAKRINYSVLLFIKDQLKEVITGPFVNEIINTTFLMTAKSAPPKKYAIKMHISLFISGFNKNYEERKKLFPFWKRYRKSFLFKFISFDFNTSHSI